MTWPLTMSLAFIFLTQRYMGDFVPLLVLPAIALLIRAPWSNLLTIYGRAEVRDALIPYEIAAPRFFYRNAGSTRHQGLEVGGDLAVAPGLNVGAVWTYSDYRFREYSFTDTAGAAARTLSTTLSASSRMSRRCGR